VPGRVLMLAHHFPPMGGSGSNRALAFSKYLPMHGWRPTVLTAACEFAANRDDSLLRQLPPQLSVIRTRSLEPRPLQKPPRSTPPPPSLHPEYEAAPVTQSVTYSRFRSNIGHLRRFPDAHIGWLPFVLRAALREHYDVAHSSSGPFTSHLVGLLLKRASRKPWVAELRDGWYRWNRAIFPDYPAWRDALERRLEAAAIRSADRVVLVTERMAEAFRWQYRDCPAEHFSVVPNGFDPAQFGQARPRDPHKEWVVVHAGALYYGRSLATLLEATRRLVEHDADFARNFRLRLLGSLDASARREVERGGLSSHIEVIGQTDHATAIDAMRNADALLLVANTTPGAEATVPGKLFEYLAIGRPVVAIAPAESSTADVLRQTGGGWLAAAGDVDSIARALRHAHAERQTAVDPPGIKSFDRRRLAGDLARIFDEVSAGAARRI
jgi:glycosyltransferase involved in cell wall biosynthesis